MAKRFIRCLVCRGRIGTPYLKHLQHKWAKCFNRPRHSYLYYVCDCITFVCETNVERVKTVTLGQFMLFMIMPVGGLLMVAFVMFVTRDEGRDDKPKQSK